MATTLPSKPSSFQVEPEDLKALLQPVLDKLREQNAELSFKVMVSSRKVVTVENGDIEQIRFKDSAELDNVRLALAGVPANTKQVAVVAGNEKQFVVDRSAKILVDKLSLQGDREMTSTSVTPDEIVASALVSADDGLVELPPMASEAVQSPPQHASAEMSQATPQVTVNSPEASIPSGDDAVFPDVLPVADNVREPPPVIEISPEVVVEAIVAVEDGMKAVSQKLTSLQTHSESVGSTRLSGWMKRLGHKAREVGQEAFARTQDRMADVAASLKVESELLAVAAREKALRAAVAVGDRAAVLSAQAALASERIPVGAVDAVRVAAGTAAEASRERLTKGTIRAGHAVSAIASGLQERLEEKVRSDVETAREFGSDAIEAIRESQPKELVRQFSRECLVAGRQGVERVSKDIGKLYERAAENAKRSQLSTSQRGIPENVTLDKSATGVGKRLYALDLEAMSFKAELGLTANPTEASIFLDVEEAIASLPETGKYALIAADARVIEAADIPDDCRDMMLRASQALLIDRGMKFEDDIKLEAGSLKLEGQLDDGQQVVAIVSENESTILARFVGGELNQASLSLDDLSAFELAFDSFEKTGELSAQEAFDAALSKRELQELEV